jgi:hypothetical protein
VCDNRDKRKAVWCLTQQLQLAGPSICQRICYLGDTTAVCKCDQPGCSLWRPRQGGAWACWRGLQVTQTVSGILSSPETQGNAYSALGGLLATSAIMGLVAPATVGEAMFQAPVDATLATMVRMTGASLLPSVVAAFTLKVRVLAGFLLAALLPSLRIAAASMPATAYVPLGYCACVVSQHT